MYRVYLIYALSGFVSLGYQVAWFRIYVDRFGSTNLTFALVVCNFIGGLGVGALLSRRLSRRLAATFRIRDRLRLYGLLEVLVTAAVMGTLLTGLIPADAWGTFPYHVHEGVYVPNLAYRLSHVGIAVVSVFVPCLFMGVTFPLLCDIYRTVPGTERFPSALYAWNTLGACSGVLVCLFLFLPRLGYETMFLLLAGLNLAIGIFFLTTGGAPAEHVGEPASEGRAGHGSGAGAVAGGVPLLITCAVLSGLLSGALEGDMFKRIDFISSGSSAVMALISFWAILAIFLASWAVRLLPSMTLNWIKVAWGLGLGAYLLMWKGEYYLHKVLARGEPAESVGQVGFHGGFLDSLSLTLLFVGLFVFPAYFCVSLLLPWVCNHIHGQRRHLGLAYGLNTLAFCAGVIGFVHLAPRVNIFYSLKLAFVLFAMAVVLLLAINASRPLPAWKPALAAAAFAVGSVLVPRGFDRSYMVRGELPATHPVRAMKSNGAHTTFVVEATRGDFLFFERHAMSGTTTPEGNYMRLMAHVPLLAHPDPKRVLLICYGVGNTASAIATHDTVESIDVVELNEKVIETASEFGDVMNDVHLDARVRFVIDDGRSFLNAPDGTYDLITSEPPPPMQAGVYRLYTREYYRQALAHLSPQGLMTQWIPTYQMPAEAAELAIRTFIGVFPHAIIFTGGRREFILTGSRSPIDLRRIEDRFYEQPAVTADLRRMGIGRPVSLIARVVLGDGALRRRFGEGRLIGDAHNNLEFLFHDPSRSTVIPYAPFELLADVQADRLACGDELRGVLTHLGRLRYHVPRYPLPTLVSARQLQGAGVRLADVDWLEMDRSFERFSSLGGAGRLDEAYRVLVGAIEAVPEQPALLHRLASIQLSLGRPDSAAETVRGFQQLEPNEEIGYRILGKALLAQDRHEEAIAAMRRAVRLDPYAPEAHETLGDALVGQGSLDEGIRHLRQALALQPDRPEAQRLLRRAQERRGSDIRSSPE